MPPDWRAGARLLESRYRSRFGSKQKVEMQGKFADVHAEMTEEDVRIATRIANRRLGLDEAKQLPAP